MIVVPPVEIDPPADAPPTEDDASDETLRVGSTPIAQPASGQHAVVASTAARTCGATRIIVRVTKCRAVS
jgi:hypothetical protein